MSVLLYVALNGETRVTKDRRVRLGGGGGQKSERDARGGGINGGPTGLVTAYKPTLRTITVTNHIIFVATTHCNTL